MSAVPELIILKGPMTDSGYQVEIAFDPRVECVLIAMTVKIEGRETGMVQIQRAGFSDLIVYDPGKDIVKRICDARRGDRPELKPPLGLGE